MSPKLASDSETPARVDTTIFGLAGHEKFYHCQIVPMMALNQLESSESDLRGCSDFDSTLALFGQLWGTPFSIPLLNCVGFGVSSQRPGSRLFSGGAAAPRAPTVQPPGNKATKADPSPGSPKCIEVIPEGLLPKESLGKQQGPKAKLLSLTL